MSSSRAWTRDRPRKEGRRSRGSPALARADLPRSGPRSGRRRWATPARTWSGAAVTAALLLRSLLPADPGPVLGERRLTPRGPLARGDARADREHGRDWVHHLRNPSTPPPPSLDAPTGPVRPAFVGTVLDQTALRALTRWRNANAKGCRSPPC